MLPFRRLLRLALYCCLFLAVAGVSAVAVLYWLIAPTLPSVESLREVRLQVPLSVLSADGKLIALFGETRRYPTAIADIPPQVRNAFIAIEDARFYEHPGVDWRGVFRAVWLVATTGSKRVPGGSTITQQVARMFFLSPEVSYTRKLREMFLALKMEDELSKDEILELYLNKSFFGNRAYGVAAAAEFYYGKRLDELSLEEAAMLASIPKFPSSGNPLVNPKRALVRRNYVLQRMYENGFITEPQLQAAQAEPDRAHAHEPPVELEAPWVAEMVRLDAIERFGDQALVDGYKAWTTLDSRSQEAANFATRKGLLDYDARHGWRGIEAHADLPADADPQAWQALLSDHRPIAGLQPAIVLETGEEGALLGLDDGQTIELPFEAMAWARPYISEGARGPAPKQPSDVLAPGDIVRVARDAEGEWTLSQLPKVQGAMVALEAETGAIRALTGGFSFALQKFNRATQAQRQPGSSFKPFVYAAAFQRGFTPATIVLDAPVVFNDRGTGKTWRPQNDNEQFLGPMRLREAMVTSRNLVSVRVLDAIGVGFARRYVQNFGFAPESLPENLSLALGTAAAPPLTMARGYATFANGGYLITPHFLQRYEDRDGKVAFELQPQRACARCPERIVESAREAAAAGGGEDGFNLGPASTTPAETVAAPDAAESGSDTLAPRAVDERTVFLVHSLLRDVVRRGTGRGALELGRGDIGGKTGTTNEYRDAWFSGFGGPLVVTAWMGMDDFSSLGNGEFASKTALPMWVEFMKVALDGEPERMPEMPDGITTALIDPSSGQLAPPGTPGALEEIFKIEDLTRLETRAQSAQQETAKEAFDIF